MTTPIDPSPVTSVLPDQHASFQINYSNKEALFEAFLPFITGGGLFVRTNKPFKLGDVINLKVRLMDAPEVHDLMAKVVWVTPKCAQGGRPTGVGAQFQGEAATTLRQKIDTHLAGMQDSNRINETM